MDLVLCSPPYEAARTYGVGFNLKGQEWVDWALARYIECVRVSRGLVAWVVEGQTRNYQYTATPALLMADLHRAGVKLRKPPIFKRVGIPGSGGPDWWRNDYEFVICSSKGKLHWSDNTAMGHPPKYAPGGAPSHRTKDGSRVNRTPSQKQRIDGAKGSGSYKPPTKANPGNVIECQEIDLCFSVFREVIQYGYATKTSPREMVSMLQQKTRADSLYEWCVGVRSRLQSEKILQPDLYGAAQAFVNDSFMPTLRKAISTEQPFEQVLLAGVLRHEPASQRSGTDCDKQLPQSGRQDIASGEMQPMRGDKSACCSSRRRESTEQLEREPRSPLLSVSCEASQSSEESKAESEVLRVWNAQLKELAEVWCVVRQALPQMLEAWFPLFSEDQPRKSVKGSNIILCHGGGGHMGSKYAHDNEAPFPEKLAQAFIASFCPPGGIVVDPFSGSGTTVCVAAKLGRSGIGIDIRESQNQIAKQRLREVMESHQKEIGNK